ncbi:MAG: hypothetical protein ACOYJB_09005 [Christensenellaceae bacterium]|jgi:hypothetical protein
MSDSRILYLLETYFKKTDHVDAKHVFDGMTSDTADLSDMIELSTYRYGYVYYDSSTDTFFITREGERILENQPTTV